MYFPLNLIELRILHIFCLIQQMPLQVCWSVWPGPRKVYKGAWWPWSKFRKFYPTRFGEKFYPKFRVGPKFYPNSDFQKPIIFKFIYLLFAFLCVYQQKTPTEFTTTEDNFCKVRKQPELVIPPTRSHRSHGAGLIVRSRLGFLEDFQVVMASDSIFFDCTLSCLLTTKARVFSRYFKSVFDWCCRGSASKRRQKWGWGQDIKTRKLRRHQRFVWEPGPEVLSIDDDISWRQL